MSTWPSTTIPLFGVDITGGIGGTAQNPVGITGKNLRYVQKLQINLATVGTVYNPNYPSGFTPAASDIYYVTPIPAFVQMDFIQAYNVTTLSGVSAPTAINLGDSGSQTRYVNGYSTMTANSVWTQAITTNPLKLYTASDKLLLQLTGGTGPYTGTIQLILGYTDCTSDSPMTTQ